MRRARQAQPAWQALPVAERIAVLKRFQRKLSEQREQVAKLISREAGKPTVEALTTEILVVLDAAEFCIRTAHSFLRDEPLPHGNLAMKTKRGKLVREPYGVIGIIAPWNYPFSTAGDRDAGCAGDGQRRRPEAVGVHAAGCAGIAEAAARRRTRSRPDAGA